MNGRRMLGNLLDAYRATGAELPGGDLLGARGVSMDGWFWRITDAAHGRVAILLAGVNTPRRGPVWGIAGLAADSRTAPPLLTTAHLPAATAARHGVRVEMSGESGSLHGSDSALDVRLGNAHLTARLDEVHRWQGRLGGSSVFQVVPWMNQYWHPWALGGRVSGSLVTPDDRWEFTDAQLYAEKNWGRGGFPTAWWWGQAQGFAEPLACVAFAGGAIHLGRPGRDARLTTEVTGLVVRTPDGNHLRLGNPGTSPVRANVTSRDGQDSWLLDGGNRHWRVRVAAHAPSRESFVLPVPLVEQGVLTPGALEHQLGTLEVTLWRDGRTYWQGTSRTAGLELGGIGRSAEELARRDGSPLPQH
ncbi:MULTISPECIES: tocopherol cyclase family protein [unclassified Luteococcus]|uniref:tocopherol cyclase family protein n=1 Tax=unclassified Luteococcus TaxID=2639923 RepID=UPI00313D18F7